MLVCTKIDYGCIWWSCFKDGPWTRPKNELTQNSNKLKVGPNLVCQIGARSSPKTMYPFMMYQFIESYEKRSPCPLQVPTLNQCTLDICLFDFLFLNYLWLVRPTRNCKLRASGSYTPWNSLGREIIAYTIYLAYILILIQLIITAKLGVSNQ